MSARQDPAPTSLPGRPIRGLGPELWTVVSALAAAVVAGALVASHPSLFHLEGIDRPATWALLAGGAVAAVWLSRRPAVALALLSVFVYLNLSEVLVRQHGFPSLLQLLVLPVAAAALLDRRRETGTLLVQGLTLVLAAWVAWLLVTTLWAWDPYLAGAEVVEASKSWLLFLLLALLVRTGARLRLAAWCLVASGTLLAALGCYQVATGAFSDGFGGLARIKNAQIYGDVFEPRIAGPLGDPNFFAQILLVLVPLALALAWKGRRRGERLLALAAAGVLAAGTVFTYSRGGALALTVVLGLAWLGRGVRAREVIAGVALVALLFVVLPADFTRRLTTLEQFTGGEQAALHPDSSFEKRRLVTAAAWRMFQEHPVVGVGAGNYTTRYTPYADEVGSAAREYDDPFGPSYPHNLYLEVAAETGLVGLALFGAVLALAFASLETARRRLSRSGLALEAVLAGATEVALAGYLVSSLFLHGHFQRYLWVLFGLAAACHDLGRRAAEAGAARGAGEPAGGP